MSKGSFGLAIRYQKIYCVRNDAPMIDENVVERPSAHFEKDQRIYTQHIQRRGLRRVCNEVVQVIRQQLVCMNRVCHLKPLDCSKKAVELL